MNKGPWIQTFTGKKFHFLDPTPDEVCIEDIAHALSNLCRFTGHTEVYYSVAQHSCLVAMYADNKNKMWGLLHDASEAYINDLSSPLKSCIELKDYKTIEENVHKVIAEKFELNLPIPDQIKSLDKIMMVMEARQFGLYTSDWGYDYIPSCIQQNILPLQPESAKEYFLDCYNVIKENF